MQGSDRDVEGWIVVHVPGLVQGKALDEMAIELNDKPSGKEFRVSLCNRGRLLRRADGSSTA